MALRSISAVRWTAVSSAVSAGLQLAQIIVLTRFLSPLDYGLMAAATVVISYAAIFSDMGLSTAFLQRQHISQEERSSLYWLSVIIGGVLMLLMMAVSPFVAIMLNEPKLWGLISLVSTNFLVVALGQQLRIDNEKVLNFRPVALIEITAAISGFAVAVTGAWFGWGVYALMTAAMLRAWISMLLCWMVLAQGWRPLWRVRLTEIRGFIYFGGGMVANNILNHINSTVDVLLGARLLGTANLGLYSTSRNLILQIQFIVNPIFTRVGLPLIAGIQHDQGRVRQIYLKIMNLTAMVNAPIYVAMAAFAPEFVRLLLGDQFQDTAPILRVLAVWGLIRSFGNPVGSLLFGLGRVRLSLWWNFGLLFIVPPALWWGSRYGAIGMACTMASVMAALFIPGWAFLVRPACGAGLLEYGRQVLAPTLCALLAGAVALMAVGPLSLPWLRLSVGLALGLPVYAALCWLLSRESFDLVVKIFRRG